MHRFFISLALAMGIVTSVVGAVLPESLPARSSLPSAERQIQVPNRGNHRHSIAVYELETLTLDGYSELFVAFLIVDLSSGKWIKCRAIYALL
jgi:hypothetical protein